MHQWKGLDEYYTMETRKFEKKFKKVRNLTFDEQLKSPYLRLYQSYISNLYINGKVFTNTTPWKPPNLIFFVEVRNLNFDFWRTAKTKRASRVLQHENQEFFFLKFEIEFDLYFDLCQRAKIIQVGLNMHLYVDIGDASSSLWGSTSSYYFN